MAFEVKNKSGASVFRDDTPWQEGAKDFHSESMDIPLPSGTMKATQWLFDGIKMSYSESVFHDPVVLDWKGDTEMITMHFNLQGTVSIHNAAMAKVFELSDNQHNMFYGKEAEGTMKVNELRMKLFLIQFSKQAFFTIAHQGNDAIKRFADAVASGTPAVFSERNLPIDANLHTCINSLLNCRYSPALKRMYFFSKSIEMLVLQAESFDRAMNTPRYIKKEYDRERILFAREYLVQHLECPPTLTELSRIAGINEFKLKKGFKEMFHQTVFEYLSGVRLEMARNALMEKQKSSTEIAFELGYSSLQHFSTAFKKKFGVSPRKMV